MLCEWCGTRDATMWLRGGAPGGGPQWESARCDACGPVPRAVSADDLAAARHLAAGRAPADPALAAHLARTLAEQAARHGQPLPADVQAFVSRHLAPAP